MLGSHVLGGAPNPPAVGTCANLMGNGGRNTVIGPGLVNFDFSLLKNNYIRRISETFNAQFRAQFFNIVNRPLSLIQEQQRAAARFRRDGLLVSNGAAGLQCGGSPVIAGSLEIS